MADLPIMANERPTHQWIIDGFNGSSSKKQEKIISTSTSTLTMYHCAEKDHFCSWCHVDNLRRSLGALGGERRSAVSNCRSAQVSGSGCLHVYKNQVSVFNSTTLLLYNNGQNITEVLCRTMVQILACVPIYFYIHLHTHWCAWRVGACHNKSIRPLSLNITTSIIKDPSPSLMPSCSTR